MARPSTVPDAAAVVADLAPSFLRCYEDELASAPSMRGNVLIEARVDERGVVRRVVIAVDGTLNQTVLACVEQHMLAARFMRPEDGRPATVVVPMTFEPVDAG